MHAYVPFKAESFHAGDLVVGKWYIPTFLFGEHFGPYESEAIAIKALPSVKAQQGTVCQTCEE